MQPRDRVADQVPKERRSRFNGAPDWNVPRQSSINRISSSSESYLKCLESSFIIEAEVEENSLL